MRIAPEHRRRHRVWSETLELDELSRPALLRRLADRDIELLVALFPGRLLGLPRLLGAAAEHGVRLGAWPMLDDRAGRWANTQTAREFAVHGHTVLDATLAAGFGLSSFVFDLEPPVQRVRAAIDGRRSALTTPGPRTTRPLLDLRARLRDARVETIAAVVPMVATDPVGQEGWQRAFGTPVDELDPDTTTAMLYSSLVVGYSRGLIGDRLATALVHEFAKACRARFGAAACASLGAVGPGALGDERSLASPDVLAADVSACTAAVVHDLALFELGATLRRDPTEAWFDALCLPTAYSPPGLGLDVSARGLRAVSTSIGWMLAKTGPRKR